MQRIIESILVGLSCGLSFWWGYHTGAVDTVGSLAIIAAL